MTEARIVRPALLLVFLSLYWCCCATVLWWAYDINSQISGGYYQRNQALVLVAKMALIVTVLTAVVWLLVRPHKVIRPWWRLAWNIGWKTAIVQVLYVFIVLARRQLWAPSQGIDDNVMFLPIVGLVNAQFLSEFGWLSFLLDVVPIMACVSGILYWLAIASAHRQLIGNDTVATPGPTIGVPN
jgi:hypothetical protein